VTSLWLVLRTECLLGNSLPIVREWFSDVTNPSSETLATRTALRTAIRLALRGPRRNWAGVAVVALDFGLLDAAGTLLVFVTLFGVLDSGATGSLDSGSAARTLGEVSVGMFLVLGYFVVRSALFVWVTRHAVDTSARSASAIGEQVLSHSLRIPLEQVEGRGDTRLQRMAFSSVGSLSSVVFPGLATLLLDIVVILAVLTALILIAPLLTLVAAVLIGSGFSLTQWIVGSRLARNGAIAHEATRATLDAVDAVSRHATDVRVYRLQEVILDRYRTARAHLTQTVANQAALSAAPRAALDVVVLVTLIVVGWVSTRLGYSIVEATATVGLLGYAALRLQPAIQRLADSVMALRFSLSELIELEDFLKSHNDGSRSDASGGLTPDTALRSPVGVKADRVTFAFGAGPTILEDIDLHISSGTRVAFLGASGSGKSTLLCILAGLYSPTRGVVTWLDEGDRPNSATRDRSVAFVSADQPPWRGTVRFNIELGGMGQHRAVDVHEALECAHAADILEGFPAGMETKIGPGGEQLSRGQEQRIAISRAFAAAPGLVVLDEATSGLPLAVEREIVGRFHGSPATVLMATHRPEIATEFDRIVIVKDGRIVEDGAPQSVRRSLAYSELLRSQPEQRS